MLDFRYHAISLIAVFLALTVGLLLGVAIGDKNLVSNAGHDIRKGIEAQVNGANRKATQLRQEIHQRDRFESDAYPLLVDGRLQGQRIGLIGIGGLSNDTIGYVRDALKQTGGRLSTVAVIREPIPPASVPSAAELDAAARPRGGRARGTAGQSQAAGPPLLRRFGRQVGSDFTNGGPLLKRVKRSLLSQSSGSLNGFDAVVLVREEPKLDPADKRLAGAFEQGLAAGLSSNNVPVVGVETTKTDPSQIPWFKDQELASVDNVDQLAGHAALVFALAGANGAYGVKSTAEGLLPKAAS